MNCLVCSDDAGAHRVVVNGATTRIEGGFCQPCERAVFGECFDEYDRERSRACGVCGADGRYLFPEWTSELSGVDVGPDTADRLLDDVDTPVLCRTHYYVLTSDAASWHAGDAGEES